MPTDGRREREWMAQWRRAAQALALDFEPLDRATFPAVDLAFEAGRLAGSAPAVLNAANEEAVSAFLDRRLGFLGIADVVAAVLSAHDHVPGPDFDQLMAAEEWARAVAREKINAVAGEQISPAARQTETPATQTISS